MIHPAAFDEHHDTRCAIYAVYAATRLKIWEWTEADRGRVVNAMVGLDDARERARAAIAAALAVADEHARRKRMAAGFDRLAVLY